MAVVLLLFAVKHVSDTRKVDVPVAPPIQPATTPFMNSVAGNGVIEAQTENIAVGSPLPGLVVEVFVKEADKVKPGSPLCRLDDRQLQAELAVRKANVLAAQADLNRMENEPRPEEIPVQEAMVSEAQANYAQMADVLRRTQDLMAKRVSTEQELTRDRVPYETGLARYREIARGQILGDDSGFFKMLFHREGRELLGVHTIGSGATELIHIGQAVVGLGGGLDYFLQTIFNYPTLAECYKVAALDAANKLAR
jgi:multidrug efflux pump subunit AcrA (membrane-fusion protein)